MYLKQIKAVGFKSFADQIDIDLSTGITGIVGPNGSGKSNVVDAIRWVLGEQSVKSLRGEGAMSDIIFAGSVTRKPSNYASVNLIFNNEDKYLPIEFNEVSIKRVLYKDGENEYFINNSKCRLKDITDLLMDSGMGKESFNIISQGEIGEILSNKPEDRRVIFEEAAGVLKYKKRKEEAIRKLERTHENLSRVNDIISELELQVEPLKRQKETAETYLVNKKELENIEISLITHDINEINYEYQNNKNKIEEINNELAKISSANIQEDIDLTSKKIKLGELDKEIYNINQLLIEISSAVEKLNGEKKLILEREKNNTTDINKHLKIVNLEEALLKNQKDIEILDKDIENINYKLEEAIKNINSNQEKINQIKLFKEKIISDLNSKNRYETELKYKIEILERTIETDSALSNSVRNVLNSPKLIGIKGIIGKLIETEKSYTTAINIALGKASEYIVTDNRKSAEKAIEYLKSNSLGRATFFPLDVIQKRELDSNTLEILNNSSGFIDVASNLLKYDPMYKNIILNQLGNVIVVRNLIDANIISDKINHRYKIVTLDGELVNVGGSMTGGKYKNKSNNLLNQKYELEDLNKKLEETIYEIKDIEEKINEFDYNFKHLEEINYVNKTKKIEMEETVKAKYKNIEALKTDQEDLKKEISQYDSNLEVEHKNIMNKYYEQVKRKEEYEQKLDLLNENKKDLQVLIADMEISIKKSNNSFNKLQTELKNMEIKVNQADIKLDNLLNILNEEYSLTFERAKEKYILEIDENEARLKVSDLKSKIKNLGVVNLLAIDEYAKVSERFEFLNNQKQDLFKAENILLEIIDEMDKVMKERFIDTFKKIKEEFSLVFASLFGGGTATLSLTEPNNILETGIDITACPPGKKLSHISLLSGGEKTLTAISLLFAILRVKTVPFCILDEVEAALDEANVDRFGEYVATLKSKTQFIIITHKKKTMEYVDYLYGITMQEKGISKLVSVKLEDIKE